MNNDDPFDLPSLIAAVSAAERDVAGFFDSLDPDEFRLRMGDAWSPAQHLDHINIAASAVARGISTSRLLLRLRFGRSRQPSRRFGALRDDYRALLARGGGATGRFVPASEVLPEDQVAARRRQLLDRWNRVNHRLRDALDGWSERDLDRLRLPHPLLGTITVREMAFFIIYHGPHHVAAAKRRLPRFVYIAPPQPRT